MLNNKPLAADAIAKALRLRKRLAVPLDESVSAIDAAEKLGIEVRLVDLPSMEGIYVAGTRSTLRESESGALPFGYLSFGRAGATSSRAAPW